jgi:ferredoxin-thioredoxin reductase catalytic subunit
MADEKQMKQAAIDELHMQLDREAEAGGYHLNPDVQFTKELIEGIVVNEERYGYRACPCRLAAGDKTEDLDIICPCDYRDPDLSEYGACYCGLYVSQAVVNGKKQVRSIPERRPADRTQRKQEIQSTITALPYPVWRCRVCGYLCARNEPPESCPICKAKKDRFEKFIHGTTKNQ